MLGSEVQPRPWWRPRVARQVRITITLIAMVFVVEYLLLPELASARRQVSALHDVNIYLVVLAVVFEVFAILAYTELSHAVFQPEPPNRWRLLRINLSTLAVSHVVPGGTAPGGALGYVLLTDAAVPGATAAFGLAVQGIGSAVVLNLILWLALVFSIPLQGFNPLYGFAAIAGVLLLLAFGGSILLLMRGDAHAADWVGRVARRIPFLGEERAMRLVAHVVERVTILFKDRRLLVRAMSWAAANWMLDATCLWIFLWSFGVVVSPIDLLVAYGLAMVLAVIPITPAGLGVVEAVLVPTLVGFGVPKADALLGVLGYRLVNFWLPIPLGGAAYLSLRHPWRRRDATRAEAG